MVFAKSYELSAFHEPRLDGLVWFVALGWYSDILAMSRKLRFSPKWLRASGSCRSVRSSVILRVQILYLPLAPIIFSTEGVHLQSYFWGACRGFDSYAVSVVL